MGPPGQTLEPPRERDLGQALADVLHTHRQALAQTVEGAHRGRRVTQLKPAAQRRMSKPGARSGRSPIAPLPVFRRKAEVLSQHKQARAHLLRDFHDRVRRRGIRHDRGSAAAKYARRRPTDRFARGAEEFNMVDADACQPGAIGIEDVHRVQTAA